MIKIPLPCLLALLWRGSLFILAEQLARYQLIDLIGQCCVYALLQVNV